jgi:hypothetical protein
MQLYKPFFDKDITPESKKYSVYVKDGKLIHFGSRDYEHYYDKLGHWNSLNHLDKDRRSRYLARAKGIKNKSGRFTIRFH